MDVEAYPAAAPSADGTLAPGPRGVELRALAALFVRLGVTAFGGPAAHIAMMEDEVVRRRRWLTHERFLDLLGATQLIPGPNSTEMAIHVGRERAGLAGLVVAGVAFIAPAALITGLFAWSYVRWGTLPAVGGLLRGVKPVIIAVVVQALWGLAPKALKSRGLAAIGLGALLASFAGAHELIVLGVCAAVGAVAAGIAGEGGTGGGIGRGAGCGIGGGGRTPSAPSSDASRPGAVALAAGLAASGAAAALPATAAPGSAAGAASATTTGAAAAVATATGGAAAAGATAGAAPGLAALFLLFLEIGSVLYGSGYVLLAFLRAELVERRGWLDEGLLLDAVAVGQVTPGPVFTTATFVGYVLAGPGGAALATLGIFLPGFVFVACTGWLIPRLRRSRLASGVLDGVNAASLALMASVTWSLGRSALHDGWTVALALASAVLLLRLRVSSTWLIVGGGAIGWLLGAPR